MANKSRFHKKKKKKCCAESWASRRNEYIPLEATAHLLIQCISLYTSLCLSNLCFSAQKKKWKDCGRGTNAVFVFLSLFCSCVCVFFFYSHCYLLLCFFQFPPLISFWLSRDIGVPCDFAQVAVSCPWCWTELTLSMVLNLLFAHYRPESMLCVCSSASYGLLIMISLYESFFSYGNFSIPTMFSRDSLPKNLKFIII